MNCCEFGVGKFIVTISAVVCSVPPAASAFPRFYIYRHRPAARSRLEQPTRLVFLCGRHRAPLSVQPQKLPWSEAIFALPTGPSDFLKPPTHPACTFLTYPAPRGVAVPASSGSRALRAVSEFPPCSRFFTTGADVLSQARPALNAVSGGQTFLAGFDPRLTLFQARS